MKLLANLDVNGTGLIRSNLTISGTLQSFQTSLLATSSSVIDGKVGTIIGVSIPQFITRNETTLPSSFTHSSLTSLGTLSSLSVSGTGNFNNVSGTGIKVKH